MTTAEQRNGHFRRLLAHEAGPDGDARAIAAAARRLWEHFARQLAPLIGEAGVAAICDRSVHLTHRQFPSLALFPQSDRADARFTHVQAILEQQAPAVATEAAVAVLAIACELLMSFIGEGLTVSLLHEAWPDLFPRDDSNEETSR